METSMHTHADYYSPASEHCIHIHLIALKAYRAHTHTPIYTYRCVQHCICVCMGFALNLSVHIYNLLTYCSSCQESSGWLKNIKNIDYGGYDVNLINNVS